LPSWVWRTSGSLPKLPTKITLFTDPAMTRLPLLCFAVHRPHSALLHHPSNGHPHVYRSSYVPFQDKKQGPKMMEPR
jgi:hypothetical protein